MTQKLSVGTSRRVYGERQTNRLIAGYQCDDCGGHAFVEKARVRVLHDPDGCARYLRLKAQHPKMYDQRA